MPRNKYIQHPIDRVCRICDKPYQTIGSQSKTCSPECYIKDHVIDFSDPDKCWIWKSCADNLQKCGQVNQKPHAHRYSYQIFNGPLEPGKYVCHRCDIPACVNPKHLVQATQLENMHDMISKGRSMHPRGSSTPASKITEDTALEIFNDIRDVKELAIIHNLNPCSIRDIKAGRTWSHLTGLPKVKKNVIVPKSPL